MGLDAGKEIELPSSKIAGSMVVVVAVAAVGWGLAVPAGALPNGQSSAQATISELEARGVRPILNKVGNAPLEECTVIAVRQGTAVKHSWVQRGPTGNVNNLVRYKTAYVDLMCTR